jgi:Rhs element Vgr protein
MMEFEAEIDARYQYSESTASAWDAKTQKNIEGDGKAAGKNTQGNLTEKKLAEVIGLASLDLRHAGQVTQEELTAWASAALTKSSLAKIVGRVRFQGIADVLPGKMIELAGVGKRFNGNAYIAGVRHEISDGEWWVDVQFGLPADWFSHKSDVMEPPASGLLPAVSGLMIGKVKKIDADPDGEHRIQVALPAVDEAAEGLWARIATLDAGKERGTFFMPEIGDEVVLGFLNDDPRDPVILGMLHSSKLTPPLKAEKENAKKGYVSRGKMQMTYDDKDKVIEISTPAGNKITFSEKDKSLTIEDQNKNKIEMTNAGITLESAKDIILKAKGDVKIEGTKIEAKAKADLKIEGTNVGLKAQAQLKAEGAAGAELSTGAIAVIKGSLVKIN